MLIPSYPVLADAPLNGDFDAAILIGELPYTVDLDTSEATAAPDDPIDCSNNGSVWFAYRPAADMTVSADTFGSDYDTVLSAFTGSRGSLSLVPGACNDDTDGMLSRVVVNVQAGVTYYFMVGFCCGEGGTGGGNLTFSLQQIFPPANDNFEDATLIDFLPFDSSVDTTAATLQVGEPVPTCTWEEFGNTIWYRFATEEAASITMWINGAPYDEIFAVYEGTLLDGLTERSCMNYWYGEPSLTFSAEPGTTYYVQIGGTHGGQVDVQFDVTPPLPDPWTTYYYVPSEPSRYDVIQFYDGSWDPYTGIRDQYWDFGDGSTDEGCCPIHQYEKDGTYWVELQVTTFDERHGAFTSPLTVATHDVAITKFTAPQSASAGQTRQLSVGVNSKIMEDRVQVVLYKSSPYGYDYVGSLIQTVPVRSANRATDFDFSYTFTQDDAAIGKVTFKVVANLLNARDALSADNEAVADPTKINTGGKGKSLQSAD